MGHPSVPMHELLEAEFAVLHGKLPPDYRNSSDASVRLEAIWAAVHSCETSARRSASPVAAFAARHLVSAFCRASRAAVCSTSSTIFPPSRRRIHWIPIDFDAMDLYPRSQIDAAKEKGRNCATGRI